MISWQVIAAGASYFVFVFFKAFQQRNVAFLHYKWVFPTSMAMAFAEVLIHSLALNVVQHGGVEFATLAPYAVSIGTGGGLGALLAMRVHVHVNRDRS